MFREFSLLAESNRSQEQHGRVIHLQPAETAKAKENVPALDLGVVRVIMSFAYEYESRGSYFHLCIFYSHFFFFFGFQSRE